MALLRPAAATPGQPRPATCIPGTFIQLTATDLTRSGGSWQTLFRSLRELGARRVIVQWSAFADVAFHLPQSSGARAPLEEILQRADEAGMRVLVGLAHDPAYWKQIERPDKSRFLERHAELATATASRVAPLVQKHKSFEGWYIPEEIDNLNWRDAAGQDALIGYLRRVTATLQRLAPGRPIAISAFSNGKTPAEEFQQLWQRVLKEVPAISELMFQDGVGVGHLALPQLDRYYSLLSAAAREHGRRFVPVVEMFEQTSDPHAPAGGFAARPAPLERVLQQSAIARAHQPQWVAFGVPEYLSPVGGAAATAAYRAYRRAAREQGIRCG